MLSFFDIFQNMKEKGFVYMKAIIFGLSIYVMLRWFFGGYEIYSLILFVVVSSIALILENKKQSVEINHVQEKDEELKRIERLVDSMERGK